MIWYYNQRNRTKLAIFDFDSLNQRMGANSLFNATFPKFDKALYLDDAAGRKDDWSDKDRLFSERLTFHVPEDMFPLVVAKPIPKAAAPSKKHEVVIMVGYPASGKSTIAKILEESGYHRVDGDSLKTAKAMVKDAGKHVATKSIVFDSTAGTKKKRSEFVKFATERELPIRVFWVQTSIDESMARNKQRGAEGGNKVPDVAFYVFRKNFEPPEEEEGFKLVKL